MSLNSFEVLAERDEVVRLALVIELLLDRQAEFLEGDEETVAAAERGVAVQESGNLLQHLEVLGDLPADVRALHLHNHRPAVPQRRAMTMSTVTTNRSDRFSYFAGYRMRVLRHRRYGAFTCERLRPSQRGRNACPSTKSRPAAARSPHPDRLPGKLCRGESRSSLWERALIDSFVISLCF